MASPPENNGPIHHHALSRRVDCALSRRPLPGSGVINGTREDLGREGLDLVLPAREATWGSGGLAPECSRREREKWCLASPGPG